MPSGAQKLISKVDSNASAATTITEVSQLAGIATILRGCNYDVVTSAASLPAAGNNTGRMIAIDSGSGDVCYRISDGYNWKCDYDSSSGVITRILWAWGYNTSGALGTGNTTNYSSPVTTAGGSTTWCKLSAGRYCHSAGIKTDSTLWVWGGNGVGQLGTGNITSYSSPVTTAGGGTTWRDVSLGFSHLLALKTDGTLWGSGYNFSGQIGTSTSGNSCSSPVTTSGGGTNWCQVSAGDQSSYSIKTDGTLWAWGLNTSGGLGTGNTTNYSSPVTTAGGGTNWCKVSGGNCFAAAIQTDGTLWTWGNNGGGQLGTGDGVARSSPATTVSGGTTWRDVSAGNNFIITLKTDGTLWGLGTNGLGQLGNSTTNTAVSPVTTSGGGTNWCQISAGACHTGAIKTDGTLWTWGSGGYGQLGTGNITCRSSPVTTVAGGTTWCQVSAGGFTLAIKQEFKGF